MNVAIFFAGFITLLIGFLLESDNATFLSRAGLILIIASLALCVASVFAYDVLLVPRKFWGPIAWKVTEDEYLERLYDKMMKSWLYLFVPAVSCFGFGLILTMIDVLWYETRDLPIWSVTIL